MWQALLLVVVSINIFGDFADARVVRRNDLKDVRTPMRPYDVTSPYDYGYRSQSRRSPYRYQQKSYPPTTTTTTPRPFIAYWQNIMRNVRVPVPVLTWNITNPLANLLPPDMEPMPTDNFYREQQTKRRHKEKRKRKEYQRNKNRRKHKRPVEDFDPENMQDQNDLAVQHENQQEHYQYLNTPDPSAPMYFFDPSTDSYYAVQRVRAISPFITNNFYEPQNIYPYEENQQQSADEMTTTMKTEEVSNELAETLNSNENFDQSEQEEASQIIENEIKMDKSKEVEKIESEQNLPAKEELMRNVLGSYMTDDRYNNQRQRANNEKRKNYANKQQPRKDLKYFFVFDTK